MSPRRRLHPPHPAPLRRLHRTIPPGVNQFCAPSFRLDAPDFEAIRFPSRVRERMPGTPIRGESGCQAPPVNAPLARRRAAPFRAKPPHLVCDRADSGPLAAFSSLHSVGMAGRPIPPSLQSEKRTQRPKLVAIAESPLRYDSAGPCPVLLRPRSARRLRRPWRCHSGPLLRPAIRRNLAVASNRHLTTSRDPRDEALRNSATPTVGSE